jgi:SET domain-containing protein
MKKTPGVKVKKSSAGLGLFATTDIAKGDFIIEYTGERITSEEANRRGGRYLFELNDKWTIDGKGRDNVARYINHSCRPNSEPELSANEKRVRIFAKKAIKVGDEITYNYGRQYFREILSDGRCRCEKCLAKKASL